MSKIAPPTMCLTDVDTNFPSKLKQRLNGKKIPQELYVCGNADLLTKRGIAICGARNVSDRGLAIVRDCVKGLVEHEIVIISGYARGVDREAHYHALAENGMTIIVLPEGMDYFSIRRDLREVWDWERVVVLSQYKPKVRWRSYQAMERNAVIVALSDSVIVIEAGTTGGTYDAGNKSLKMKIPLYVIKYGAKQLQPEGNDLLIRRGATSLGMNRTSNHVNISKVIDKLHTSYETLNHYERGSEKTTQLEFSFEQRDDNG